MIFELVDGRQLLYQWDLNRKLYVNDESIKEVHFCNRTGECSLVVEVIDGVANIPNILLQSSFDIRVFGYDGEATLHEEVFKVKPRTRPADYVYTETEVLTVSQLAEELRTEIEERLNEVEEGIITDGFATTDYVDEAINNVSVDLSGYAKESYVDEAITQVRSEHTTDLANYAKKTDIPDVSNFITEIPSEYITETELNAKGYLTQHQDISGKADVNHTHTGYANSKHTHDQADINGLQIVLSEKATQADIDKAIELHNHNSLYAPIEHNHDDKYSTRGHVHSYNDLANKPTIPSIEGLATEKYVDEAIANIETPEGGNVDLSDYYTKEEIDSTVATLEEANKFEIIYARPNRAEGYYYITSEEVAKIYANQLKYKISYYKVGEPQEEYTYIKRYTPDGGGTASLFTAHSLESNNGRPVAGTKNMAFKAITISSKNKDSDGNYIITEVTNIDLASKEYVDEALANAGGSGDLTNYYTKEETNQAIQDALNAIGVAEGGAY